MPAINKFIKNLICYPTEEDATEISRSVFDLEIEDLINSDSFFKKQIGSNDKCLTYENIVVLLSLKSDKIDDNALRHLKECPECSKMYEAAKDRTKKILKKLDDDIIQLGSIQHSSFIL